MIVDSYVQVNIRDCYPNLPKKQQKYGYGLGTENFYGASVEWGALYWKI